MTSYDAGAGTPDALRSVLVVGTGLIGTSIGLALTRQGVAVSLLDRTPAIAEQSQARGAGTAGEPQSAPDLVVLAVPPGQVPALLAHWQQRYADTCCTDVSSAHELVHARALALGCDPSRFVGGHPMAGREQSGPAAASAELFEGRTWVLLPSDASSPQAVSRADCLARTCGARVVHRTAAEHDRAVALVSHAPQLLASLAAARLLDAAEGDVELAGSGVQDLTRIAGSDPALWVEILSANAGPVAAVLSELGSELDAAVEALRRLAGGENAARAPIEDLLARGSAGRRRLLALAACPPPEVPQQ